jgi:AraC-like DNA-binding protein
VEYRELPLPVGLDGLVKTVWTLDIGRTPGEWVDQDATPDGCIEIIRRLSGRSRWRRDQPELFVAGVIDAPATLTMSGDARFIGIRLWPWAWNLLDVPPATDFLNDWFAAPPESLAAILLADPDRVVPALCEALAGIEAPALVPAILRSGNVAELSIRSGLSYRQLQRWFSTEIGIAPRRYVKLLRFQKAFVEVQSNAMRLADHAAARGYADQAHMTRDFREMAGSPPVRARVRARGPFL